MSIGRIDQESRFVNVSGTAFKQGLSGSKEAKGQSNASLQIDQRTESARNKATKLIKDAFGKQEEIEKALNNANKALSRMATQQNKMRGTIEEDYKRYEDLAKQYGDTEKGENENSDLGLLIRAYRDPKVTEDAYKGPGAFSDEEKERYKNIDQNNLSDYQKDMYSAAKKMIDDTRTYDSVSSGIAELSSSLTKANIDLLKDDSMVKVQKAADTINSQAIDQNMLSLIGEGVEKLDERQKEEEEKAEKAQEKQEAQEKQKAKSDDNISDTTKKVEDAEEELNDTKKELDKIVKDMGAFSDRLEDLYGLIVDDLA